MQVRKGYNPNVLEVESESDSDKWYQVYIGGDPLKCTCKGYLSHKTCKHVERVKEYLQQTEGGIEAEEAGNPLQGTAGLFRWIKKIHGRDFIEYQGLLAMAHEQGLMALAAEFISVTSELALAAAHAVFKDGRKFWEAADATPGNVNVKTHFARCALTRAKARVLRDALNIGMIAVEELEE